MSATLLTAALLLAAGPADLPARAAPPAPAAASAPTPAPAPAPTSAPLAAAEPAAAPATVAPATAAAAAGAAATAGVPDLRLPRSGVDAGTLVAPLLVIAGLGGAAWVLRKRRRPGDRRVEVLETTSLGPKRSLVLARFEDELLLLGASESGIQLLRRRPGPAADAEGDADDDGAAPELPAPPAREPPSVLAGFVTKLRRVRPAPADRRHAPSQFDALLAESAEDQELRRKLARGQGGNVR